MENFLEVVGILLVCGLLSPGLIALPFFLYKWAKERENVNRMQRLVFMFENAKRVDPNLTWESFTKTLNRMDQSFSSHYDITQEHRSDHRSNINQ